jgi:hypothetical protein
VSFGTKVKRRLLIFIWRTQVCRLAPSFSFGDVHAELTGLKLGAGFLLTVNKGTFMISKVIPTRSLGRNTSNWFGCSTMTMKTGMSRK